ncbi:MAG: hypothetical protein DRN92_04505 [Thermoproteota archaeon]|nr:MAG: hypothetical protein DRN92_04505 [Candidatus Korarchaeota archaeon]
MNIFFKPFAGPYSEPKTFKEAFWRYKWTVNFIKKHWNPDWKKFLDIGHRNIFTSYLEETFGVKILNTFGDLDRKAIYPEGNFDVIFCFEVLEHLCNPLWLLDCIYEKLDSNGALFLSTPSRLQINWATCHFCEHSLDRLSYLFEKAKFVVTDRDLIKIPGSFGIRPVIRKIMGWFFFPYPEGIYLFLLKKLKNQDILLCQR